MGLSNYVPYKLRLLSFMAYKGYEIVENKVYQGNQSAIKIEKNGRDLCTGNSMHVDIRYSFVRDRFDKGEVKIAYCPIKLTLVNFSLSHYREVYSKKLGT